MTIIEQIRARPKDAPMPTEQLLDEAADTIAALVVALEKIEALKTGPYIDYDDLFFEARDIAQAALALARRGK